MKGMGARLACLFQVPCFCWAVSKERSSLEYKHRAGTRCVEGGSARTAEHSLARFSKLSVILCLDTFSKEKNKTKQSRKTFNTYRHCLGFNF